MSLTTLKRTTIATLRHIARLPAHLGALVLTTALVSLPTSTVNAAVQATTSNTASAGSVDIDLIMGLRARITGLADMPLGVWSGTGAMTANDNICIGTNAFTGLFRIRASGDGEPGDPSAFTLSNGASQIKYNAFFNDRPNPGAARLPFTGGVTLNGQTGGGFAMWFNGFGCLIENANVSIEVPEAELSGGTGTYTGTLTLLLLPE